MRARRTSCLIAPSPPGRNLKTHRLPTRPILCRITRPPRARPTVGPAGGVLGAMYRPASIRPFFNTPSRKKRVVWADFRRKSAQRVLRETKVTTPGYIPRGRGTREDGRRAFGNRARVVGLACSPTMQTPSPTTKLLAGIASEACLLYTSPSPRDSDSSRMPSSA